MKETNTKKKNGFLQITNSLKTNSDRTINSITPLNNEKSISVNSKTNSINPIKSKFNREIKNDSIFELGKINLLNNNSTTQKIDSTSSFLQSFSDEEKYYIDELTSNLRVPKKLKNNCYSESCTDGFISGTEFYEEYNFLLDDENRNNRKMSVESEEKEEKKDKRKFVEEKNEIFTEKNL